LGGLNVRVTNALFNALLAPPPCGAFLRHNAQVMSLLASDLALQIDFGRNEPGDILQRWDRDNGGWQDYKQNKKVVFSPFDIESLPPGRYRLRPVK